MERNSAPRSTSRTSGGPAAIQPFCDFFETGARTTAPSNTGLSSTLSEEQIFGLALQAVAAQASADSNSSTDGRMVSFATSNKALLGTPDSGNDSSADSIPPDSISWEYQVCTRKSRAEAFVSQCHVCSFAGMAIASLRHCRLLTVHSQFGYFQISNSASPDNIVTTLETTNQIENECTALFPTGLPPSPNVTAVTQFGGWTQNPTRVMFTNGEREWSRNVYVEYSC